MSFFTNFVSQIPFYLLRLPVVLFALSLHETAHGYVAYKLGDPTARSLGRLTLNPAKHLDPFGFVCMVLFRVGWAKPVPINTRYFKKPKRDMAICGAAGPLSNLALAIVSLVVLRVALIPITNAYGTEMERYMASYLAGTDFTGTAAFTAVSLVVYILYLSVILNISLAIFNLIPVPPFDGSRIFYAFLPTKWYFAVMKYERIIMMVVLVAFMFGFLDGPINWVFNMVSGGLFVAVNMPENPLNILLHYVTSLLTLRF